uniref:Uncharacterized protein n=1 Tax=Latimeria chalumnae TaxID=7897 RepID=H3A947_LATCH
TQIPPLYISLWPLIPRLRKFSQRLSRQMLESLRLPTSKAYYRIWNIFTKGCSNKQLSPKRTKVSEILEFVQDGSEKGLSISSLKMGVAPIGAQSHVKRLLRAFKLTQPGIKNSFPQWDLNLVLNALSKAPFETIGSISLFWLTIRTALLIALVSARRIS